MNSLEWQWILYEKNNNYVIFRLVNTATKQYIGWNEIFHNYSNYKFVSSFIKLLTEFDYFNEYYLEFNPVSYNQITNTIFEFVLIKTSGFASNPDITTFGIEKLNTNSNHIIWFPNPSNTALLIVPCFNHSYSMDNYIHIGKFMKSHNVKQKQKLVIKMFELYFKLLKSEPNNKLWLSTHGKGVGWLHIRIDKIPRYITWNKYK